MIKILLRKYVVSISEKKNTQSYSCIPDFPGSDVLECKHIVLCIDRNVITKPRTIWHILFYDMS